MSSFGSFHLQLIHLQAHMYKHTLAHGGKPTLHCVPVTLMLHMVKKRAEKISTQLCGWLQLGSKQSPEVGCVEVTHWWPLQHSFPYQCSCPASYTVAKGRNVLGVKTKYNHVFVSGPKINYWIGLQYIHNIVERSMEWDSYLLWRMNRKQMHVWHALQTFVQLSPCLRSIVS